jgi:multidrug resistance efflux pump
MQAEKGAPMVRKYRILIILTVLVLILASLGFVWFSNNSDAPQFQLKKVERHDIKMTISTNGIIEPVERTQIYSPIDAFVKAIQVAEGAEIARGQLLMRLEAQQIRTQIAEAKAALLESKRQAQLILSGPTQEETSEIDASIADNALQLDQLKKDLETEQSLYSQGAVPRESVDRLRKQKDQFQLRSDSLKTKRQALYARYSDKDKELAQARVNELLKQVDLLEQQLRSESILSSGNGLIYSLSVKPGSFVKQGDLLAEIYRPGNVWLRAYVDEPDLGRIQKGQPVLIGWNGLPDHQWAGSVEKPAEQVVALNNRSVGNVLCSITDAPKELIPNLNVQVEITTAISANALIIPRSAFISPDGKPSVLCLDGKHTVIKPIKPGIINSDQVEVLDGIREGDAVIINPGDAKL